MAQWLLTGLILLESGLQAAPGKWDNWHNSLMPEGRASRKLTLASNGKTDYRIAIPAAATSQDRKAAADLVFWLKEMTGAVFPVIPDTQAEKEKEISIGKTNRLPAARLTAAREDLGDEGYAIAVKGRKLFLWGGRKRGPINAVYALLEEDLGCRWYAGEATRIPHHATLTFTPVARSYVPRLKIRDPFYKAAFDGTWSLRNRTNAPSAPVPEEWGGHIDYALFVHTVHTLVPPDRYFKDHPEYYMMEGAGNRTPQQLCMTAPEVIRIASESALKILKEHPHSEIISVSKTDGGGSCVCPRCKALDESEGSNAGSLLYFVNRVAEAVEKEFPHVTVDTLAYLETVPPPKTIRPRKNVAIRLCTDTCMWSHPFTPAAQNEGFKKALLAWAGMHDRIHIWDYCVNFSHYTAPMPNMDVIADNIRFFVRNNVRGVMEQGAYQSPGAERDLMRSWAIAKLMWDPSRNLEELEQDFICGFFGKAAPAIAEYNELLKETAREYAKSLESPPGGIRYPMDSEFLSKAFLERATALYDRAEKLAENEEIRHRVEQDRIPVLYVLLCRGPEFVGESYKALVDRFEIIARRVGLTHIYEGPPDVENKIKEWRAASRKSP